MLPTKNIIFMVVVAAKSEVEIAPKTRTFFKKSSPKRDERKRFTAINSEEIIEGIISSVEVAICSCPSAAP